MNRLMSFIASVFYDKHFGYPVNYMNKGKSVLYEM